MFFVSPFCSEVAMERCKGILSLFHRCEGIVRKHLSISCPIYSCLFTYLSVSSLIFWFIDPFVCFSSFSNITCVFTSLLTLHFNLSLSYLTYFTNMLSSFAAPPIPPLLPCIKFSTYLSSSFPSNVIPLVCTPVSPYLQCIFPSWIERGCTHPREMFNEPHHVEEMDQRICVIKQILKRNNGIHLKYCILKVPQFAMQMIIVFIDNLNVGEVH